MEELIKRLERVIATGAPDKNGMHPISAETVLEVVNELSEHGTNLARMKAWIVDDPIEAVSAAVVFAETRGQAKVLAQSTDACEDMAFTDIRAVRAPELDQFYRGKSQMDWLDPDDRIAMVQYGGFHCSPEVDVQKEKCEACPAHEWCDRYEDTMEGTNE